MPKHGSVQHRRAQPVHRTAKLVHADGSIDYISLPEVNEAVDTSSEDSFPASDPPSFTPITHTGEPKKHPVQQKPQKH